MFKRARSRFVAFSRANSFFSRVRARLGVFCHIVSYLFVILRHFSSFLVISRPNIFFPGMAGNGRARHWLGSEGSSLPGMVASAEAEFEK